MKKSVFEYVSNLDTLIAVVIGGMLATLGALFAELIAEFARAATASPRSPASRPRFAMPGNNREARIDPRRE